MNGKPNLQFWQEKHFFRQNRGGFTKKLREQKGGNLDISCDTFLQWTLDIMIQGQQQYIHNSPKWRLYSDMGTQSRGAWRKNEKGAKKGLNESLQRKLMRYMCQLGKIVIRIFITTTA